MWYGKEDYEPVSDNQAPDENMEVSLRAHILELEKTVARLTAERDALCEENAKITVLAEQLLEIQKQQRS